MIDQYSKICMQWEAEFARNRAIHGPRIQCRRGCSDCCGQLFQITEVEAAVVSQGVALLPEGERRTLAAKAEVYLRERRALVARHGKIEAWGSLPPPGARLPCPALTAEGACSIYEHRPLICRKFGVPLYYPDKPGQVFACELNFRNGDAIEDGELVTIQTGLHGEWKQIQQDYDESGGRREAEPITVARAILEDFRSLAK